MFSGSLKHCRLRLPETFSIFHAIPIGGRIGRHIAAQVFADERVVMLGRQPVAGAHAADAVGADDVARLHILHKIQRTAELDIALLARFQTVIGLPQ